MDGYDLFFVVNGKNPHVHLHDFGDTFVQQYMLNRNNAFLKRCSRVMAIFYEGL